MPAIRKRPSAPRDAARIRAPLDEQLDARLFKALSDPTRLRLLSCLVKCGRPCSVTEVAASCAVDFSVVNKHLKLLTEAGVLAAEKHGRVVWYAARCGDLSRHFSELVDAIAAWCPNLPAPPQHPAGAPCCEARP